MTVYNAILIVVAMVVSAIKNALKAFGLLGGTFGILAVIAYSGLPPMGVLAAFGFYAGILSLAYGAIKVVWALCSMKFFYNGQAETEKEHHRNADVLSAAAQTFVNIPGLSIRSNLFVGVDVENKAAATARRQERGY